MIRKLTLNNINLGKNKKPMKKILGFTVILLLSTPLFGSNVDVSATSSGTSSWVVIDQNIYFCYVEVRGMGDEKVVCIQAEIR